MVKPLPRMMSTMEQEMEYSSKLKNTFSLSDIKLDGFGASGKWAGYFQRTGEHSHSLVDKAVALLDGFLGSRSGNFLVVTALSYRDEREKDVDTIKRYQHIYDEMKSRRLLLPMSDEYESYLYGESPLPAGSLSFSFEYSDFIKLSRLLMCHAGVAGQVCFCIIPALNMAIYPHDDIGYGCVALNSDVKACREFLDHCSECSSFEVVFGESCQP